MLPDGIGVIPLFNNVRHGKIEECQTAIPAYEEKIAEPAEDKVDSDTSNSLSRISVWRRQSRIKFS